MEVPNVETLTARQAFDAMVLFLENYYQQTKSDDVGALLGDLSFDIWSNGSTADPGAWSDWMECVHKVLAPDTPENH